jgi:magnesium chelatase family protein
MLVKTFGSSIYGINAITITVEVNIDIGVQFMMVGLARQRRERKPPAD